MQFGALLLRELLGEHQLMDVVRIVRVVLQAFVHEPMVDLLVGCRGRLHAEPGALQSHLDGNGLIATGAVVETAARPAHFLQHFEAFVAAGQLIVGELAAGGDHNGPVGSRSGDTSSGIRVGGIVFGLVRESADR